MVKHATITVVAILLAVTIAVSSSPFHDGWAVKKDFSMITGRATDDFKKVNPTEETPWWAWLFKNSEDVPDPEDIIVEESPVPEPDIPSAEELQSYVEQNEADEAYESYEEETSSQNCATNVDDRMKQLNDRVTALENGQTTSACATSSSLGSNCLIKVIDSDIMVIPGEKYDCNDACKNDRDNPRTCAFGMLAWRSDEKGAITNTYLTTCKEQRTTRMYENTDSGDYREKKVYCVCC